LNGSPTRFPFQTSSAKRLKIANPPVITVIGKAFWDTARAPKDQSNHRKYMPGYAVWEIHPVNEAGNSIRRATGPLAMEQRWFK
jgi:hypothetical protein